MVAGARVRRAFPGSSRYWEHRYQTGGSSGPGSYGAVAEYKAGFLNDLVAARGIESVIEFGCGDGNQVSLSQYPCYIGLDVSPTAVSMCLNRFADDDTKSFFLYSPTHFVDRHGVFSADLAISLDVILHLVEDDLFGTYMSHLFAAARQYVVIYSSDDAIPDAAAHVRHRPFSCWVETHQPGWTLTAKDRSPHWDTALADFYLYERHQD